MKIAITGKGGVGKTTLSGTLSRLLAQDGYKVLAIDADPDMNLASAIGLPENPAPITDYEDLIEERAGGPAGMFKYNPKVDDIVDRFAVEGPDGVQLMTMGTVERGGSGCMCPASAFLRALLRHVVLKRDDAVILDMEAGIEHLGRGTSKGVDLMITVVEPGQRSIETAERIRNLAREINVERVVAVINKADDPAPVEQRLEDLGIPVLGWIPRDQKLVEADLAGQPPVETNGPAIGAIREIKDRVIEMVE